MEKKSAPMRSGLRSRGPARFAPSEKPKAGVQTLRRLLGVYRKWTKQMIAATLLTGAASAISVAVPYLVGQSFNYFHNETLSVDARLTTLLFGLVALYAANTLIMTVLGVMMLKVTQSLVHVLRADFFTKLQKLPLSFYDTRTHGDTMSRLTNDVDNISSTLAQAAAQTLAAILSVAGSLAVMLYLSFPLTLVVLLSVPLITLLTKAIAGRSRAHFSAQQRSLGELSGIAEEAVLGIKTVKAFGRRGDIAAAFARVNEELYQSSRQAQTWSGFMMPLSNVVNNLVFTLLAIAGGLLSALYALPVGTVVSFVGYSKQFAQPLNALAGMYNTIQSALAGAERVFEILDQAEEPIDRSDAVELVSPRGAVVFENVSFSYDGARSALQNVSFSVRPGETVALVGETGAGKTTIASLLNRFYDVGAGRILIDGIDLRDLKRGSLRRIFSVVLQDTCLFSGSILDNIRYARMDASDEEVIAAAKLASAHAFIEQLPDGYRTKVSGSADSLSQGQRQLISIARALLRKSPILILDEATSSVDTKTEKAIQHALRELMQNRTSFLIAHRLSTIRDADRIFVIENGRIAESGNHETLMKAHGSYFRMVKSQIGDDPENLSSID